MNRWVLAARPKTLPAAAAPVILACSMAVHAGAFKPLFALGALAFALAVQIATNFANDYLDFAKGADTEARLGPTRAVQAGLVTESEMQKATALVFFLAACIGILLSSRGGYPMLGVTALSLICGYAYTGGPYPLGYNGLGEVFVLFFFGPVAVGMTYYLQALELPWEVILMGFTPGLLSTAIIVVNNLRDQAGDSKAGKRTLAVRFGTSFAKMEYVICMVLAAFLPFFTEHALAALAASLCLPFAGPLIVRVFREEGRSLNEVLAGTGKFLLAYSLFVGVAWNL